MRQRTLRTFGMITATAALLAPPLSAETIIIERGSRPIVIVPSTPPAEPALVPEGVRPSVDVALLLDTSNSMDGLIDQARRQLWGIVRTFAEAQKAGRTPLLRVALFEYGNTNLPASEGYLRQVVPLTDDLDAVSAGLFALTTNGGDEYCGQVIDEAVKRLSWSGEPGAYRAIFIAGNEPFTQGGVGYQLAVGRALGRGIVVNTIHCGERGAGVSGGWQNGATLGEGRFFNINQDRVAHVPACPQDPIILRLNAELNETYLWYGAADRRRALADNQVAQDEANAQIGAGQLAERAAVKAGAMYRNVGRDLVDSAAAAPSAAEAVAELSAEELPAEMQAMTGPERVAHVEAMAARRAGLQRQIAELQAQREAHLATLAATAGDGGTETLGQAVQSAVREQLRDAGFAVE